MATQLSHQHTEEPTAQTSPVPFPYDADRTGSLPTLTASGVLSAPDSSVTSGSTACPACGAETIDGAGLFACTDCEWTGTLR